MRSRWAIIWAVVLILGGAFLLAQNFGALGEMGAPIWSVLFAALGVLFLLNFITATDQWWSLIPGCILVGLGIVTYLPATRGDVPDEVSGSLILFSVGLPFLGIYITQTARGQKHFGWALIPGGLLTFIAILTLLATRAPGEIIGTAVLWAIGLPFLVAYFANRKENWWALIPGGVMLVIGLMPLLTLSALPPTVIGGVFFLGLAAVFGLLYLLNPTGGERAWAIYPAAVLLAVGIGVVVFGSIWWPVVLIALGVILLVRAVWPRPG